MFHVFLSCELRPALKSCGRTPTSVGVPLQLDTYVELAFFKHVDFFLAAAVLAWIAGSRGSFRFVLL